MGHSTEAAIFRAANAEAEHVYSTLEPVGGRGTPAYLALEEAVSALLSDAMHRIGAELEGRQLDPRAQAIFEDPEQLGHVYAQIRQEIAEHVFKSTRQYLDRRRLTVVDGGAS